MFICHIGGDACPLSCIGAIPNTTSDVSVTAVADGDDFIFGGIIGNQAFNRLKACFSMP